MIDLSNSVIYISGPMSGLPEFNFPAFRKMEEFLKENCHPTKIHNPMYTDQSLSYDKMVEYDMGLIQNEGTTHLILLKGWNKSNGAKKELALALNLGLQILTEEEIYADSFQSL